MATPSITTSLWLDQAEAVVTELESESSIEVVMAVARSSGNYRDAQIWLAVAATWLVLGLVVTMPFEINDLLLLPIAAMAFFLSYALASRPPLKYLLVPRRRRRQQVEDAAVLAFHREHVAATVDRTGLLVYLSEEEQDFEFLPDYGIDSVIPKATWNNLRQSILAQPNSWTERFLSEMKTLKPLLSEKLPRRSDDRDELPNRPRVMAS